MSASASGWIVLKKQADSPADSDALLQCYERETMIKQDLAILFSGGTDSLSLYVLSASRKFHNLPSPRMIHLLYMLNGMSGFEAFPLHGFKTAEKILKDQTPLTEPLPEATFIELRYETK